MRENRFNKITYFFILLSLILAANLINSGKLEAQNLSTEGDDFWVAFLDNWLQDPGNPIILEIYISADDSTRALIEMPLKEAYFTPIDTLILPNQTVKIQIPSGLAMSVYSNLKENNGIHISTEKDVSVYAMNKRQYSADMAVILPTITLGNDYIVVSHWEEGNRNNDANSDSEFLVMGIEDNTSIRIVTTQNTNGGNTAGEPFEISLNKGQTYQIKAKADLTGSTVQAVANTDSECKKFAVFAGNMYTKVGECDHPDGHDHLFAQMYPKYTWGKDYTTVDFNTRINGDHVKVIVAEDNTDISLNGNYVNTLNAGQFLFLKELDGVNAISGSKPISVAQFSRSQACDGTVGDPFIILINPNEQVLEKITFFAPTIATIQNFNLSIVTTTSDVPTVVLDNTNLSAWFQKVPGDTTHSYAKVSIGPGNHILRSENGVIAYVYGYGYNESFGYPTGAGLSNLNMFIHISDGFGVGLAADSICHETEVWFNAITEFEFTEYKWDFGDGTILTTDSPDSIAHTYEKPGKYIVELTGSTGTFGCVSGSEQSSVQVVRVLNPRVDILGPRSVCPFTDDVLYRIKQDDLYNYEWFSFGGNISDDIGNDSIHVDWGGTNTDAWLKVLPWNDKGCYGDTIKKDVKIKLKLEPEAPFGPDTLCADHIDSLIYDSYFVNNTQYTWDISFGEINSGQGGASVVVDWDSFGTGKLWFEQMSTTDSVCAGISDTLSVFIQRKPDPEAEIISEKTLFGLYEPISLSLVTDTLFNIASWQFSENSNLDSVSIQLNPEIYYDCPGSYEISVMVVDTMGICEANAFSNLPVEVYGPQPEIIQVTHENDIQNILHINWKTTQVEHYKRPYILYRNNRELDSLNTSGLAYVDTSVLSNESVYEYKIITHLNCPKDIETKPHNNILLSTFMESDNQESVEISWNSYINWQNGVSSIELWMDVDSAGFEMFETLSRSAKSFQFNSNDLGFEHCFKVRAFESGGNNSYSWSNIQCATFIPELYPYNIITPNGDKLNEVFVIDNIEFYPNSVLTIFNRWGKQLYKTTGYQNNWGGYADGKLLPNSTYYYVLELNEPRANLEHLNGMISIMR